MSRGKCQKFHIGGIFSCFNVVNRKLYYKRFAKPAGLTFTATYYRNGYSRQFSILQISQTALHKQTGKSKLLVYFAANLQSKTFNVKLVSARAASVLPVVTTPRVPPTSAAYLCGLAAFGQIKEPMRLLAGNAPGTRRRDASFHCVTSALIDLL